MRLKNHEGTITVALENRTSRVPSIAYLIGGPDRRSQRLGAFDGTDVVRTPRHRQRLAGWLFVPYLIRILFASYLNLYVLAANGTGF